LLRDKDISRRIIDVSSLGSDGRAAFGLILCSSRSIATLRANRSTRHEASGKRVNAIDQTPVVKERSVEFDSEQINKYVYQRMVIFSTANVASLFRRENL
jgi:hypothetical protein